MQQRKTMSKLFQMGFIAALSGTFFYIGCGQNFSEEGVDESLQAKGFQPLQEERKQSQPVVRPVPDGARSSLGGISVVVPAGWLVETPSSSMRTAQYRLPSAAGDGSLAVFRFGPGRGGGVEDNMERWLGQFQQPDGRDSRDVARFWKEEVDGVSAHLVDVSGTFSVGAMSGGSGEPQANYTMLGAILEAPNGLFVFKLTGPDDSIREWRDSFSLYIQSVRLEE